MCDPQKHYWNLEGYSVDVAVIFTRSGAPSTAVCPLLPPILRLRQECETILAPQSVETAVFDGEKVRIASGRLVDFTCVEVGYLALNDRCALPFPSLEHPPRFTKSCCCPHSRLFSVHGDCTFWT